MTQRSYVRAPHWRRAGAALLDAAAFGGLWWLLRRRELIESDGPAARVYLAVPHDLVRQGVRTPGELALGTRTVDKRTGTRVAPWRTLVLAGVSVGSHELTRRLAGYDAPERTREQRAYGIESYEIFQRYPQASAEREAALRELSARYPRRFVSPGAARAMAAPLVVGLVNSRLRRRLAPTVEVLARGG